MKLTTGAKRLASMQKEFPFKVLSGISKIPASTLSRYARGHRIPVLAHAVKLEDALSIEVRAWLRK